MPYADKEKQKEYKRLWTAKKYAESEEFRLAEKKRKEEHMKGNEARKAKMREYSKRRYWAQKNGEI